MTTDLISALLRDLKYLYERVDDHNVILKVGKDNIKSFNAHSVILKSRSEYLRNFINNEYDAINKRLSIFKKDANITLEIPHISPEVFKVCLRYIYTGEVSLQEHDNEFIFDLLIAADELQLIDVVKYIQIHLIEQKSSWIEQNIIRVYQASLKRQNFNGIQIHCKDIITPEPESVFGLNSFSTLERTILLELIQRDDLSLQEIKIWRHLVKWGIEQDPPITENINDWIASNFIEFEKRIRDFIPHIRFFTISSSDYHIYVRPYKKAIPEKIIDQIEEYYLRKTSPPPNALRPRKLKRTKSKHIIRKKSIVPDVQPSREKEPPAESISEGLDEVTTKPLVPDTSQGTNKNILAVPPNVSQLIRSRSKSPGSDFKFDSILINKMQIRRISHWIDGYDDFGEMDRTSNPKSNFFLLARGSRDGMTKEAFNSLCNNKGPTIILAKVDKTNDIIGGYNPKSWSCSNEWIKTTESFIFSFKSDGNREGIDDIILSRVKNPNAAIWDGDHNYDDIWFSFDLQLFNGKYTLGNYNKRIMNYDNFKIIDYEVFQVKKKKYFVQNKIIN